jgi:hypothetical protein
MIGDFLKKHITSQAEFIQENGYGYGQVEPNHLSAQATKEVYAQLPADKEINILENGQFVKYDYANGVVNFTGAGEWMLVFNEIKLYRDFYQGDCEFAMIKDNYQARVYSPFGGSINGDPDTVWDKQSRYYNGQGVDAADGSITFADGKVSVGDKSWPVDDVTGPVDIYEPHYNEDPFHIESLYKEAMMPEGTTMVPRVLKTHIGDIYTTNMIGEASVAVGDELSPRAADGVLSKSGDGSIVWQVVKVYTMPDHQPGVKLMRIK